MNNSVFEKTKKNVAKRRDLKLITTEKKEKLIVVRSKLSYYKVFHGIFIDDRNEKNSNTNE